MRLALRLVVVLLFVQGIFYFSLVLHQLLICLAREEHQAVTVKEHIHISDQRVD
jgi:hypothetical protein